MLRLIEVYLSVHGSTSCLVIVHLQNVVDYIKCVVLILSLLELWQECWQLILIWNEVWGIAATYFLFVAVGAGIEHDSLGIQSIIEYRVIS